MGSAQPLTSAPERVTAQLDYFTASWKPDAVSGFPEGLLMRAIHGKVAEGHAEQHRTYEGVHYLGAAGIEVGWRGDERFVHLRGDAAHTLAWDCYDSCSVVSRIDPSVTAEYRSQRGEAAYRLYRHYAALPIEFGQPRGAELFLDTAGGATCGIGSKHSDVYLRFYDWGVRHQVGPAGCRWRFEAQIRGRRAKREAALLFAQTQRELAVSALTRTLFTDRRVSCPWDTVDLRSELEPRRVPTVERRLAWLSKQVAPPVRKLIEDGYIEAALEALGIEEFVTIKRG